ncbi:HAT (Half-A-TPR) repeat-containing protein [Acrodontium crateriforme]|uniref:HAT (Half-A-TPR) repeat-containing protein n=1 Tax=Acrodontium crateriforme TaxID=150365 RepID=A0AAQ3LX21_9PEZI|nr:HAT (Half-A-TPR) repeat-containing protein [Acrodontium crateriforme]
MSAASDKARFYLEQYVPELQEYARKNIFTRDQISAITAKRSDFEHILNARGSTPSDYARYATYEMNLDNLRKKRCKRLGVKSTTFSGQRTIFFILDRATKKFPGDMGLWMQYIHYCQKEKANKKLGKIFTQVLRLKPREYGLWVLAAKYYAEGQGDMSSARSYMQRGLRFCNDSKQLYLEYTKLEMVYLAKLAARRKILGLDETRKEADALEDENMIVLPQISVEDIDPEANKGVEEVNAAALEKLASAPAFTGAIPKAIFDAAMKQFKDNSEVAEEFFDLVASFNDVQATTAILQHILDHLLATSPNSPEAIICESRMSLQGIDAASPDFPAALGSALIKIKRGTSELSEKQQPILAEKAVSTLLQYVKTEADLDEAVILVLESSLNRYLRVIATLKAPSNGRKSKQVSDLVEQYQANGKQTLAQIRKTIV